MSRAVIRCGWDDVPHLTDTMINEMTKGMMPHLKDARMKGTPTLGSGAIYPVPEEDITYDPAELFIDDAFPRLCSLDVGWKKNAAVWGAYESESDTIYIYDEYYRGYAEPAVHASAIKKRGDWMTTIIDSAANGSNQENGRKLFNVYLDEGLTLVNANKGVDAGLLTVYQRLSEGRLKISKRLVNTLKEFRIYRRDEKGKIVKQDDHLMDALRYLCMGTDHFKQMPVKLYKKRRGHYDTAKVEYNVFDEDRVVADDNYDPFNY